MSRSNNILRNKDIEIEGKFSLKISSNGEVLSIPERLLKEKEDIEKRILEAREEYEKILLDIERQRESIISDAKERAKDIEKKSYSLGYEQGLNNGYEDGYKESYEKNIDKAIAESEKIKEDGYKTLLDIRNNVATYINDSKEQILKISISIAEQVLREKFEDVSSMTNLIENIIREYELKKDMVIKTNPTYIEELRKNVDEITKTFNLTNKIFVVSDSGIDKGNAEIEINGGKLTVGIDSVLDKVKAELL